MVVAIAKTALETANLIKDEAFLAAAYDACVRWDNWLSQHQNTRGTGLYEAFCESDAGHNNGARCIGLPKKCPNDDASICPKVGKLPLLAPDRAASVCDILRHLKVAASADLRNSGTLYSDPLSEGGPLPGLRQSMQHSGLKSRTSVARKDQS
jgi:hypothetical protein